MYDVIIVGAGPAGLTAGLYAARSKMKTLVIEKLIDGGQIIGTDSIENYPGAPKNSSGPSLISRLSEQVKEFGAERASGEVIDIDLHSNPKKVITSDNEYLARSVIIATGATPRRIGCPGEMEYEGRGVSYCATCDAPFAEGMHAYVVGGGDSAVEEAIFTSRFASKVTIIHRRDELRAAKSIQEKAFANEKIDFMWNTEVVEIKGEKTMTSFVTENVETGERKEIFADDGNARLFLFAFIGLIPNSQMFKDKLEISSKGYIITDDEMNTNIEGVFAAGDIREKSLRQVVTATSDGAIAAISAEKYLTNKGY